MTVNLPTDIATFVNAQVASGAFKSADEVLRAAVQSYEREGARSHQEERLKGMLQAAVVQVENGETLDVDAAFDEIEMDLFGQKLPQG